MSMTLPDETIGENTAVIILGEVAEQAAVNQIPTDVLIVDLLTKV